MLYADDVVPYETIRVDDEPLDPPPGLVLMMNKPLGVTCSRKDPGRVVYDLLPPRYSVRSPALSSVGRLDRDTSGLLLFTDDGALLHRIISPKAQVTKVYEATLAQDLRGDEGELFASGTCCWSRKPSRWRRPRLKCWGRDMPGSASPKAATTRCAACSPPSATMSTRCSGFRSVRSHWVGCHRASGACWTRTRWR